LLKLSKALYKSISAEKPAAEAANPG